MKDVFNMVDFANGMLRQQRDLGTTKSEVTIEITPNFKEQFEFFNSREKKYVQYEYHHSNGKVFHMIGHNLYECRLERDLWIERGCEL